MTESKVPAAVRDGTPAQKLVYKVLEHADEPLDQDAIADRSLLPKRTVREMLSDLEDAGAVTSVTYMPDTRKKLYCLDK
ncbi:ArsR family transcriptional regulator [Natrinema pallidum]|uniref:ArsR family transcriptional regulator n=1 Tax=Natrinema pallidum TaxID=69527 RepID=UPI003750ECA7